MKKLERLLLQLDVCKIPRNLTTYLLDMIPLTAPHVPPFDLGCFPFPGFSRSLQPSYPFFALAIWFEPPLRNAVYESLPSPLPKNRGNPGQELNHSQARLIDVFASNGTMYSRERCNVAVLGRDSVHRGNGKTFKAPRSTKCSCARYLCESRR